MEHYKKTKSVYTEDPIRANELRVTGAGKVHDLSTRASFLLKEHPREGVHVSAVGAHVTKAVTVVELLKRKVPGLQAATTIKYAKVEDIWEPDMEGLDSMKVTRKIPSISMHLLSDGTEKTDATAESASPRATTRPRPSSGGGGGGGTAKGRGRKRAKSSTASTAEGGVAEDGDIGRLSDLKLQGEAKDSAVSAKKSHADRGRGKGSRRGRSSVSKGNHSNRQTQSHDFAPADS